MFSFNVIGLTKKHRERIQGRLWKKQTYIFIGIKLMKQQQKLLRITTHHREIPLDTTTDKTEFI